MFLDTDVFADLSRTVNRLIKNWIICHVKCIRASVDLNRYTEKYTHTHTTTSFDEKKRNSLNKKNYTDDKILQYN